MQHVYTYLLQLSGFDGAFLRDRDLVLLTGPLVNDGQRASNVPGWWDQGLSREAVWLESWRDLDAVNGRCQVCSQHGQATPRHHYR